MRVSQLPKEPRVLPHVPNAAVFVGDGWRYCSNVHVWPMYSFAVQIECPSATDAE
jgi:hypothetical protein